MCEPMTIMAATAAASFALKSVGSVIGQQEAASNAERAGAAANDALVREYKDLQARRIEEAKAAAAKREEAAREARATLSTAQLAAAEGGASAGDITADLLNQEGRAVFAIERNLQMTQDQLARQAEGLKAKAKSRINQAKASVPSPASVGIKILGDAAGTVGQLASAGVFDGGSGAAASAAPATAHGSGAGAFTFTG